MSRVPDFWSHIPRVDLSPVLPWLTVEVHPSYSVPSKQESNQKEMYLCFLGWLVENIPSSSSQTAQPSPLLACLRGSGRVGMVVGVIQEAQAEGGGVGTMNTGEC